MKKTFFYPFFLLALMLQVPVCAQEPSPSPSPKANVTYRVIENQKGRAVKVRYPLSPSDSIRCQLQNTIKVRSPRWVAALERGGVYVAHDNGVDKFGLGSGFQFVIPINHPMGIAANRKALYVVEQGLQRILVFDHHGKPLAHWGSLGKALGQFDSPTGIAVMDVPGRGHGKPWWWSGVYVADEGNHRIEAFTENGEPVTQWGSFGKDGHGTFDSPFGIAVDRTGTVFVSDRATGLIQCFDANGNWKNQWNAAQGTALDTAAGIAVVEANGEHVFALGTNGKACIFDATGDVEGVMDIQEDADYVTCAFPHPDWVCFSNSSKGEVLIYSLTDALFDESDD